MSAEFNVEMAINGLSLGQVGYGILNSVFKQGIVPNIFPKMGQVDMSVYDHASLDYRQKLQIGLNKAFSNYKKDIPFLNIWHLNMAWLKISEPSYLLTFHELDQITEAEKNILNSYNGVFVASQYTKSVFENGGVNVPVIFTPLGVDPAQTFDTKRPYLAGEATVWTIIGKFENRKRTKKSIQGWIKLYGGNPLHRLHLFVTNPFFKQNQMNDLFADVFNNQLAPSNVILYGHQPKNSLINDALNCTNIIIDMSGGEGLSLPSLNALALGKHGVIHNCTAMKDWATPENATLVEPSSVTPVYDGVFFQPGQPFNQGNIYDWEEKDYLEALQTAYSRFLLSKDNIAGKDLANKYNYDVGADIILKTILK